jgi:hypothetical protein
MWGVDVVEELFLEIDLLSSRLHICMYIHNDDVLPLFGEQGWFGDRGEFYYCFASLVVHSRLNSLSIHMICWVVCVDWLIH